jgi:hypothetical protein
MDGLDSFSTGGSLKRGSWIADYCKKGLELNNVLEQEVLGRFVFAAQEIEHWFPLLGPLDEWVSMLPPGAFVKLPGAVRLLLRFIEGPRFKMMNGGSRKYRERRCVLPGNHSAPMPERRGK